jgi:periplasmic copper chaperone A
MRKPASFLSIASAALMAVLGISGCATSHSGASAISLTSAYVALPTTPGTTVAYLDIRNNGTPDRLISAQTSVGGTVQLRSPDTLQHTGTMAMHTVSGIPIPSDTMVRLNPVNGYLLITGAGPMQSGKAITLKLTFADAGTIDVLAVVTNPQDGGSSYFLN